jgi:hypothetical protein
MAFIERAQTAFTQIEAIPSSLSFEIIRRVDLLETFPKMGVSLRSRYPQLQNCRQIVIKRAHRVVYKFNTETEVVYILAVQHCRQRLPATSELRRAIEEDT